MKVFALGAWRSHTHAYTTTITVKLVTTKPPHWSVAECGLARTQPRSSPNPRGLTQPQPEKRAYLKWTALGEINDRKACLHNYFRKHLPQSGLIVLKINATYNLVSWELGSVPMRMRLLPCVCSYLQIWPVDIKNKEYNTISESYFPLLLRPVHIQ